MKIKDTEKKQTKKGTAVSRSKILSKKENDTTKKQVSDKKSKTTKTKKSKDNLNEKGDKD